MTNQTDAMKYLDIASVMFVIINADQTVGLINKKGCEILGYPEAEIIGVNWFNRFVPAGIRENVRNVFTQILSKKIAAPEYFENPVLTKNNEERIIAWHNSLLTDSDGKPYATLSSGEDITQRRKAEADLLDSEKRFKALFESAAIGIVIMDSCGRIGQSNPAAQYMFDYNADELSDKNFTNLLDPNDLLRDTGHYQQIFSGQCNFYQLEKRFVRKNGQLIWGNLTMSGVKDTNGNPLFTMAMIDDITERKKTEEALKDSEEKYRSFFDDDLTGDYISTIDGKIILCNPAFCRIFGFADIEEAQQFNLEYLYPTPESRAAFLAEVQKRKKLENYEMLLRTRQGEPRYVVSNVIGLFGRKNELIGIKGYIFDITLHKKTEQQFLQAQKMEAIGRLAGGVAHDFNNLLSVINGYSQLLLEKIAAEDSSRHYIELINKAGQRAESLTRQLLAFSRRQIMQPKILNLNELVTDLEKLLHRIIGEDIELVTYIHPQLGRIQADPSQMEQVIMNLVLNARDAMPNGGKLTIETSNTQLGEGYIDKHPMMQAGSYVMLAVSDTGVGMNAEVQANIFEPFFTTKPAGKGTGLGLSTVYGIVKQSGGFIWVYSEIGKGSTFKIYLPRVEDAIKPQTHVTPPTSSLTGSETILIAEDDTGVLNLIDSVLSDQGYTILKAENGDEAIKLASEHPQNIHLMITDVVMPTINGRDLARQLTLSRPQMKVLYVSGYTDDAIVHHGILDRDVHFLQKPFNTEELLQRVRRVLDEENK